MNLLFLLASFTLTSAPASVAPSDSIGVELRGGQRFVKHRVTKSETLFGIARRYNVRLDQLQSANPQLAAGLRQGQVVLVPRGAARPAAVNTAAALIPPAAAEARPASPSSTTVPARYTVARGETLFGIARRFSLTPAELIRLNRLPAGGRVRVGQELLLSGAAEAGVAAPAPASSAPAAASAAIPTPPAVAKVPEAAAAKAPATSGTSEPIGTVTPATSPVERRDEREEREKNPTRASEVISRVTESGLAATIERSGTDKYLALHKTAPVGMIMQVRNAMNGQSVYVRVIGKLPDTGENNNILVRLSPRAVQKLGTPDARFRVETSYVP
ncbi:LysM peptidoglycan-binding domain-containing protein [uncultured Hymenobacter sp.]|uniref:LysM peptidoglycan-binding domain-containing protein n=1 Tax=uncultured Hymenobacter sp. TaxID=170016 RepID=UPI0035CBC629